MDSVAELHRLSGRACFGSGPLPIGLHMLSIQILSALNPFGLARTGVGEGWGMPCWGNGDLRRL